LEPQGVSVSSERAYAHIKNAILSGRYPSGTRLPEDKVAAELGVSRTPIRDALRRLQVEQLITITPYSGARVAGWTADELREIAQIRAMLEAYAAGLAARKRSPDDVDTLNDLCDRMEDEAAKALPDTERLSQDNLAFHRTVARAAENTRLAASLEPLWSFPATVRRYALFGRERMQKSLAHHREIVAAIDAADPEWADAIMRVHVLASRTIDASLVAPEGDGAGT
jgi:DNA-binding GntR family transcriptional regulator